MAVFRALSRVELEAMSKGAVIFRPLATAAAPAAKKSATSASASKPSSPSKAPVNNTSTAASAKPKEAPPKPVKNPDRVIEYLDTLRAQTSEVSEVN